MKTALINLVSEQPIPNLLAIKKYKPNFVYFLHSDESRFYEMIYNFENYIIESKKNITIKKEIVDPLKLHSVFLTCIEIIEECKQKSVDKIIINTTGGTKLMAFGALQAGNEKNCPVVYVNTPNKEIINVNNISIGIEDESSTPALVIEEFIELYGAKIDMEKTAVSKANYKKLAPFVNYAMRHLDQWKATARYLNYAKRTFYNEWTRNFEGPTFIRDEQKRKLYCDTYILKLLVEAGLLSRLTITNNNRIRFIKRNLPEIDWFLQYGTPMELYIFSVLSEEKNIDDLKISVEFVWDEEKVVNNELDIMVSSNSKLTCISCKSGKFDTAALNELETYAKNVGGTFVNKLLVTTKANFNHKATLNRAEKMGIKILAIEDIMKNPTILLEKL